VIEIATGSIVGAIPGRQDLDLLDDLDLVAHLRVADDLRVGGHLHDVPPIVHWVAPSESTLPRNVIDPRRGSRVREHALRGDAARSAVTATFDCIPAERSERPFTAVPSALKPDHVVAASVLTVV
jgi:hypothetical protein